MFNTIKISPKLFIIPIFFISFFVLGYFFKQDAFALTTTFPKYDVTVDINKDTTFEVTEDATYEFTGELNGIRRDITLRNNSNFSQCSQNDSLTCGGFDIIQLEKVSLDGRILSDSEYTTYIVEDSSGRYFRIEKRIFDEATYVSNRKFDFEIKYKIIGGIQVLENNTGEQVPYFYWNMLPENRGFISESRIQINFPNSVNINLNNLNVFDSLSYLSSNISVRNNSIIFKEEDIFGGVNLTTTYEFGENELLSQGEIIFDVVSPIFGGDIYWNGLKLDILSDNGSLNFPVGEHQFEAKRFGYYGEPINIKLFENEVKKVEIELQPTAWMSILLSINTILLFIGIIAIPIFIFLVVQRYRNKGRDQNMPKTIIPIYSPPENIRPYLLGSLKDEKVDTEDVIGSLIDLAYRGFIKIKELEKRKNYELTRINVEKEEKELDEIEKEIINTFFGGKTSVKTKDLPSSFATKYQKLKDKIEDELVNKGYFKSSPKSTRNIYLGIGIFAFILGIISTILGFIFISQILGTYFIFTFGIAIAILGLCLIIVSQFMPAKTELGSKMFAKVLGFKMYMETAERYRVQNLTPELFEKYLSYAVVFKIERKWANNFKNIENIKPEWIETNDGLLDVLIWSSFANNFSTSVAQSVVQTTTASSTGGGWSSGGSFGGGFSGGGGGGGGAGGW